ncbi:MAG TPA: ATP-binding protein [Thermoanaerobaculia bacterium]|nr:ATP-binding protein [Thermoanaerobaculia bacterium]
MAVETTTQTEGLPETGQLAEEEFRKIIRAQFTEIEIDLILALVSQVPVGIWAASGEAHDFAVRLWSPGAERLYGFTKEEILGKNYIEKFVNRLERRQAIADHKVVESTRASYRNLARDQRSNQTTRLMLTQGTAIWHPVLGHYLQGEITVDATDVPGKDRSWLEQVLTPESVRVLLDHFTEMTQAAFVSIEKVTEVAGALIKVFLGESAELLAFIERSGAQLARVGPGLAASACEFDPKALVRWCMTTGESTLVVDYLERHPPQQTLGRHSARFPGRLNKVSQQAPFAVGVVSDEANQPRGGIFVHLAPGTTFSELTDGILAAVSGTVKLALAIEDKIAQTLRTGSLATKERERQATIRLAKQYRHAVLKKADLLEFHSGLLLEKPPAERIARTAAALSSMAQNLVTTGKNFETNLREEEFNLGDVLSSVTGAVIDDYLDIQVLRDDFPPVIMRGVRPFIEGAFESLLLNAVEAQKYRGKIGVSCSPLARAGRSARWIDVFICDNGPGVPAEIREKLREGHQITTKGDDRGLGLVIARLSFEECRGELEPLDDPIPGWEGACFRVRIPVTGRQRKL